MPDRSVFIRLMISLTILFSFHDGVVIKVWRFGRASDEEALKIVLAYLSINEPERRREVLALAEKYAAETTPHTQDNHQR